ncbi:MAG TPA: hypothetical protein VIC71_03070 [Gammaproteobacteria bacterium]|jgi:hypothetical protein
MIAITVQPTDIDRLDGLLQAAQTFRLSEQGRARDVRSGLAEQADPDGSKLGAFTLGVLDSLLAAHDGHSSLLPLLIYVLMVNDHGPGTTAVEETKRILALERSHGMRNYVRLGRQTAMRAFVGEPAEPGAYAELLLSEVRYN